MLHRGDLYNSKVDEFLNVCLFILIFIICLCCHQIIKKGAMNAMIDNAATVFKDTQFIETLRGNSIFIELFAHIADNMTKN